MPEPQTVLLDTDAWSLLYLPRHDPRTAPWRKALVGATVAIATQTRAEVLAGILQSDWGEPRREAARHQLDRTATIPVDESVILQYATITVACRNAGHALHDRNHTADRWIAATAAAWELPLLSGDRVFDGTPGLPLLSEAD